MLLCLVISYIHLRFLIVFELKDTYMEEGFSRKELELRLAPPGDQEHTITKHKFQEKDHDPSLLCLGNSYSTITTHTTCSGSKRGLENSWLNESQTHKNTSWSSSSCSKYYDQQKELLPVMKMESSQRCCSKGLVSELQNNEKHQPFSPDASTVKNMNTAQKRFILFFFTFLSFNYWSSVLYCFLVVQSIFIVFPYNSFSYLHVCII